MRKLLKVGLFLSIAVLMAGCSNLWDYTPPVKKATKPTSTTPKDEPSVPSTPSSPVTPSPSRPSSPSGPSYTPPASNTLTFYVNDGSGEAKEVKVTVSGNTATIAQIKAAFSRLPSSSTLPPGFTIGDWYESDSKTVASGSSYSNGGVFVIGYKANPSGDQNGYTVSFAKDSTDGQRKFVTTPKTDGDKTLAEILGGAGLTDPTYDPSTPAGWTFKHWAKPDATNAKIDPQTDTNTYPSDTNFVAVYEVPYNINVGGVPYTVKVSVTGPNKGATWEQIKAAALALPDSTIPAAAKDEIRNNTWGAKKPSDTDPSGFGKDEQFPANTDFSETIQFKYTIYDINGNKVEVDFGPLPSSTVKTLADIIDEAKRLYGSAVDFGKGRGGNENVEIKTWDVPTSGAVAPGEVKPTSKELTYKLTYKPASGTYGEHDIKVTVGADKDGATLQEIFAAAGMSAGNVEDVDKNYRDSGTDLASGWKVNDGKNEKIVSSSRINDGTGSAAGTLPPGTKVKPNWVTNADAAMGGSDRNLSLDKLRTPQIGDGVTSDGKIIEKDLIGTWIKNNSGKEILGYIYHVDPTNHKVKVVAKEVRTQRTWSREKSSLVYTDGDRNGTLRGSLTIDVESGYDAWYKIRAWNDTAILGNYYALIYAVCYPNEPEDFHYNIEKKPIDQTNPKNGFKWEDDTESTKIDKGNDKIISVVEGDGYDKRWYLPTVIELLQIYAAKDALLNWTVERHTENGIGTTGIEDSGKFWSVIVSDEAVTENGATVYSKARYVDFSQSAGGTVGVDNKYGTGTGVGGGSNKHYILPVAEFKYEDYQVNH